MNLVSYLLENYPGEYKKQGPDLRSTYHSSLVVFGNSNRYYRFSKDEAGNAIDLLQRYHDVSFDEAKKIYAELDHIARDDDEEIIPRKACSVDTEHNGLLKESANGTERAMLWLQKERSIPTGVLKDLKDKGLLYGNALGDAVFTNTEKTRCIIKPSKCSPNSPREYGDGLAPWCFTAGNSSDIFICESPIDAISLYLLRGKRWGRYYAMGGLKKNVIKTILAENEDCTGKTLAVDWDKAGKNFVRTIQQEFNFNLPDLDFRCVPAGTKDWSDLWQLYCRDGRYQGLFKKYGKKFYDSFSAAAQNQYGEVSV